MSVISQHSPSPSYDIIYIPYPTPFSKFPPAPGRTYRLSQVFPTLPILIMKLIRNKIFLWLGQKLFSPICLYLSQRGDLFWLYMLA